MIDLPVSASSEAAEQAALFQWIYIHEGQNPELRLAHHVPNAGKRAPWKARAMGLRRGVPDFMMPAAGIGSSYGLALEFKYGPRASATDDQSEWLRMLDAQGWQTAVVRFTGPGQWVAAARIIAAYLGMPGDAVPA